MCRTSAASIALNRTRLELLGSLVQESKKARMSRL
jgi:hypothetical protein